MGIHRGTPSQVATVPKADLRDLLAFNSLCDDLNAFSGDRFQQRPHDLPACLGALHRLHEIPIQLEKMGRAFGDLEQP